MIKFLQITFLAIVLISVVHGSENIQILQSNESGIIFELKPFELSFEDFQIGNTGYKKISSAAGIARLNLPGKPQLPVVSFLLGVPQTSSTQIQILESHYEVIENILLAPAPSIQIEDDATGNTIVENFHPDGKSYSANNFQPSSPAEILSSPVIRNLKTIKLAVYPVQYNPVKKTVRHYTKLKIQVIFNGSKSQTKSPFQPAAQDYMEPVFRDLIANYPIAQKWKTNFNSEKTITSANDWYDPGLTYFKIKISEDGLYHLTYSDLNNYGIDLNPIDPRTIQIFNKGVEVPIRINGEEDGVFNVSDFIEFYGEMNYGDHFFYDDYSDTNIYWMTYGATNGKRYAAKSSMTGSFGELMDYTKSTRYELDKIYYKGDKYDVIDTELVSGETWIWKEFYANDNFSYTFFLKNPDINAAEFCSLTVRLRGETLDAIYPDHLAKISINNNELAEVSFDDKEEVVQTISFESSLLNVGSNQFKIESLETGAALNKFYFDWLELKYPAAVRLAGESFQFKTTEEKTVTLSLWDVKSDSFSVYNLSEEYHISDFTFENKQRHTFKLLSAGFDDGNFCQIEINSENAIWGGHRGHNIAIYDTTTGEVGEKRWFDTLDNTENADSMAAFISRIPVGKIVLVAIRDEGSYSMTEAAHLALESLGSSLTRQVGFRDSYVLLGRKGAAQGTVPELHVPSGQGQAVLQDTIFTHYDFSKHLEFSDIFKPDDQWLVSGVDSAKKPDAVIEDHFVNLKNTENQADYIFITHKKFFLTAEKFAMHWEQSGYQTFIADIDEIYDEFNFGIKHVNGIKEFLRYTYENWNQPAPTFVMLIGDASWDPKKNSQNSIKEDFIPTYGNPVSDNWLVCFDGENDFLPDMVIGRLAIESNEEGERFFRKVENYSTTPSAKWKKHILFINGGFDDNEQYVFGSQTNRIIDRHVTVPPSNCFPVIISKELDGLYEGEKREEIIDEINNGKLWVNFIGHGGSGTWELMFHDQQVFSLENEERLPFVTSFTCHTGRFANPEITNFGENFVNYSEAGAIGFVGTSGWGFVYEDDVIANKLFESVLIDTIHQMGLALIRAKLKFWSELYPTLYAESVVKQYSLLGDPALEFALPKIPDLSISEEDASWLPESPVEMDSIIEVTANIFNFGLATPDSINVIISDNFQFAGPVEVLNTKLPPIGYKNELSFPLNVSNRAGEHLLEITVNPESSFEEVNEENNSCDFSVFIGSSRITISLPGKNMMIPETSPLLQVNNPASNQRNSTFYFEMDSVNSFNSNALIQSPPVQEGLIVTNWMPSALQNNQLFYWRCREDNQSVPGVWINSIFSVGNEFGWLQKKYDQFEENEFINCEPSFQGIGLLRDKVIFRVESSGYDDLYYAVIFVNGTPVATAKRGHNVAICNEFGNFVEFKNFDTHDKPDDVANMVTFIGNVLTGYYVLVGIMDTGVHSMTEEAYQALETIGSQYCRNVGFRDSWAIIGKKGAAIGSVPEKWVPRYQGTAIVEDSLTTFSSSGYTITQQIGPANEWKQLSWSVDSLTATTNFSIDVIGFNKTSLGWDTIMTNLTEFNGVSLTAFESDIYPFLKLKGNFSSSDRFSTPLLNEWKITYTPVSDIAINEQVVRISPDTLIEGSLLNISADVHNVGYISEDSVRFKIYYKNAFQEKFLISENILQSVEVNHYQTINQKWDTKGKDGRNQIYIEIDPENQINELSDNNNIYFQPVLILSDTSKPNVLVSFDGKEIQTGDYVSQQPVILINIFDNSPAQIESDTSRFHLLLDGQRVTFFNNEDIISLLPTSGSEDPLLRATLKFTPTLTDGHHSLDIFVNDANENSAYHNNNFNVESELKIFSLLNYPNPFSNNTFFTFHLTQPVEKLSIKIYTTSGRQIHKIESYSLEAGYQQIFWDGLDMDGDVLANGVYLYKVIARSGQEQAEKIEKVVVMR